MNQHVACKQRQAIPDSVRHVLPVKSMALRNDSTLSADAHFPKDTHLSQSASGSGSPNGRANQSS